MRVAIRNYDYERRIARLHELMRAGDFDGAYVTAGPNMYYLCGFSAFERGWPIWLSTLLIPRDGEPVLILSAMHEEGFRGAVSWVDDVRTYVDGQDPSKILRQALEDTGLASGRLALQDDAWLGDVRLLESVAPAARIASGGPVFDRLRIVKDADEIDHLRRVSAVMDDGYAAAHEAIRAGRIEHEVAEEIAHALVASGSERLVVNGHFAKMTSRRIEAGDVIDVDLAETSCSYYEGDTGRIYFVEDVSAEHRSMHEVVLEAYEAALAAIAPGVPAEDVHRAGADVVERAGYVQSWKIGHGVGLTIHEPPFVQEGDRTALEPGMVFVVDPGMAIVEPYYTTIRVEDMVLVTEDGFEVLSRFTRELLVV